MLEELLIISQTGLSSGLSIAGGLLPAVGIGLLLRYLPVKSYFGYLIVGFVAAVYLNIPILGVALVGFAIAMIIYKNKSVENVSAVAAEVWMKMSKKEKTVLTKTQKNPCFVGF